MPETFRLDPKAFDYVLNVVTIEGALWWHVHKADSTYRQTVLLTQPSQQLVSSAVHKLEEAFEVFGYQLCPKHKAVDLGNTH